MRRILRNALLLLTTLAVTGLAIELCLRVAGLTPHRPQVNEFFVPNAATTWSVPDAELGWINKEGTSVAIGEGQAPMHFWSFGRRASRANPEIPPDNRTPVMIIGGSDAQSYGVRDEESFAALLAARYPNLWIENFGTAGYGTVQSLMLAERAYEQFYPADRKPKLILLTLGDSHPIRNVADQSWIFAVTDSSGHYMVPPHYLLRGGQPVFHPFQALDFWPLETHSAAVNLVHTVWLKSVRYNTSSQAVPISRFVLSKFASFAADHGMLLAVAVLVDDLQTTAPVLAQQPFPMVDCSALGRTHPEGLILAGSGHPNAKLHAHYADCLSAWLDADVLPRLASPAPGSP